MDPDQLLRAELLDTAGSRTTLLDHLGVRRTVVVFVRHFG